MTLMPYVELVEQFLASAMVSDVYIPILCLAFIATVPCIFRTLWR